MKKIFFSILALTFVISFSSCLKNGPDKCTATNTEFTAPIAEVNSLKSYLQSNSYTFQQDPHGFFYNVTAPGSGAIVANLCSTITCSYVGKLKSGVIFDQTAVGTTASFQLGSVIYGWQKGIPYVAKGGKLSLYIPPSLGYGANPVRDGNGNILIPANSDLFFDITVVDIN